jgi:ketosteroid isomerase-like protein
VFSWLAKRVIRRNMDRLNAGDPSALLAFDAEDVRFRFPGDSSWAGEFHGKAELEPWLRRFADTGLQIRADEVVAQGPPWRTTVCVRGTDHLDGPDGRRVYENRYVIWGRMSWGRLSDYEVYEDTQASSALDAWLEGRAAPAVRA